MSRLDDVIHELRHTLGTHGPGVALKFNEKQIEALKLAIAAYALDAAHDSGVFFEAWSVCGNADQEAWERPK